MQDQQDYERNQQIVMNFESQRFGQQSKCQMLDYPKFGNTKAGDYVPSLFLIMAFFGLGAGAPCAYIYP